jgi:hypothetical protein
MLSYTYMWVIIKTRIKSFTSENGCIITLIGRTHWTTCRAQQTYLTFWYLVL